MSTDFGLDGTTDPNALLDHPEDRLTRDRWGRPLINPPGGGAKVGYRRASSFGAPLESDWNLQLWAKRQVARGISHREDLALAVTRAEINLDSEDPKEVKAAKSDLDALAEQAMEEVKSSAKASIGTSVHAICELLDLGRDAGHIPTSVAADVKAYRALTEPRFSMVSVERFIVHDELKVAGTLDRAAELLSPIVAPDGTIIEAGQVVLADVKTSQDMSWAGCKFAVQCFVYADGTPYDTTTGQRVEWGHTTPRLDWGLIVHVPSGQGTAGLYWVDLEGARGAAVLAASVHEWRGKRGKALIQKADTLDAPAADTTFSPDPPTLVERARVAGTVAELEGLYFEARRIGAWTDDLLVACRDRKVKLLAGTS